MELVLSESNAQSWGYSVTIVVKIVKNMNYVGYLNLFKVLKTTYMFLEPIVNYSFDIYMENRFISNSSMIYL